MFYQLQTHDINARFMDIKKKNDLGNKGDLHFYTMIAVRHHGESKYR